MASECGLNIECRLTDSREFDESVLIIGEIAEVFCEERYLTDGKPDCAKMDPLLFFMPEGPYLKTGEAVARAFEAGRNFVP
jgi:flavin reductase (DIM6/NTAB) family NADH-FMN oxidoreductase RutF